MIDFAEGHFSRHLNITVARLQIVCSSLKTATAAFKCLIAFMFLGPHASREKGPGFYPPPVYNCSSPDYYEMRVNQAKWEPPFPAGFHHTHSQTTGHI
jgi:hypothetical protein